MTVCLLLTCLLLAKMGAARDGPHSGLQGPTASFLQDSQGNSQAGPGPAGPEEDHGPLTWLPRPRSSPERPDALHTRSPACLPLCSLAGASPKTSGLLASVPITRPLCSQEELQPPSNCNKPPPACSFLPSSWIPPEPAGVGDTPPAPSHPRPLLHSSPAGEEGKPLPVKPPGSSQGSLWLGSRQQPLSPPPRGFPEPLHSRPALHSSHVCTRSLPEAERPRFPRPLSSLLSAWRAPLHPLGPFEMPLPLGRQLDSSEQAGSREGGLSEANPGKEGDRSQNDDWAAAPHSLWGPQAPPGRAHPESQARKPLLTHPSAFSPQPQEGCL
ncbi:uncharacterized protein LOC132477026 [Mesoplodon densirostris]|uniref:uncharacterized protein LOC132477026 n=1 Tax=Mesoplodon densirostris TaxID=48708 RepID=UPI0028DC44A0|nr:uncharacterized protein LOC132477026 [Mesoplodon densirostris]